jgi:ABC-2 type transport system permease protein
MLTLLSKEIKAFLGSLIGYIVLIVFLSTIGLFMWIFPGELNILDSGYSHIDTLFYIAPWVFMFLIPAITMRSFADEKKAGTIELLLTRPLTDMQIIFAKYAAGVVLVLIALIPTLIYFNSVYDIGNPVGNIDTGGTWGSYIGLLFLASAFVSVGIFASSLTENQLVAFIIAVFVCFFMYVGFEYLSTMPILIGIDNLIITLGINEHYASMSRGVIDTRDIIYFLSMNAFFLSLTQLVLKSRKW